MAENVNKTNGLDRMRAAHLGRYPDRAYENDEAMYEDMANDYDSSYAELEGWRSAGKGMAEMYDRDPRTANLINSFRRGEEDPVVTILRLYGDDIREALDNPDMAEKLAAASAEYRARQAEELANSEQFTAEAEANFKTSTETVASWAEKRNISPEQAADVLDKLVTIAENAYKGIYTEESLDAIYNAGNYEQAVSQAASDGEIRGRNSRIKEARRAQQKADGSTVPTLQGSGAAPAQRPPKPKMPDPFGLNG